MDITTGLLLTAIALTEDRESPMGHVGSFDVDGSEPSEYVTGMQETVQDYMAIMDKAESMIQSPTSEEVETALYRMADQYERSIYGD